MSIIHAEMIDFDFNLGEDWQTEEPKTRLACFKAKSTTEKLRIISEANLEEVAPWHFEDGYSYHFISQGDVDSLTYLRHVLRQQKAYYVLLSTWCMQTKDAEEMRRWLERGIVDRFDFYVGEIFKNGYRGCLEVLEDVARLGGGVLRASETTQS